MKKEDARKLAMVQVFSIFVLSLLAVTAFFYNSNCREVRDLKKEVYLLEERIDSLHPQNHPCGEVEYHEVVYEYGYNHNPGSDFYEVWVYEKDGPRRYEILRTSFKEEWSLDKMSAATAEGEYDNFVVFFCFISPGGKLHDGGFEPPGMRCKAVCFDPLSPNAGPYYESCSGFCDH